MPKRILIVTRLFHPDITPRAFRAYELAKENGLLYGAQKNVALTWMDAVVDGVPVTPRSGYTVELNALWYNAICFSLEMWLM